MAIFGLTSVAISPGALAQKVLEYAKNPLLLQFMTICSRALRQVEDGLHAVADFGWKQERPGD